MLKHAHAALAAALIPLVAAVHADDDLLQMLDQENQVYAASRYAQSLEDTPASVSVLTRDDMQRYGYYSLDQAILALPGVHDASNLAWPMYGIRGIAKPGDICSRLAVLINGMPAVYDPVFGGTCFHMLDIESLKRLEFVRGPGSSVYGSGASLGVFNLVTEDADDVHGVRVSAKASSANEGQAFAAYGGRLGEVKLYTSLSAKSRKGLDFYFSEYDNPGNGTNGWSRGNDGQDLYRHFARLQYRDAWLQWRVERNRKVDPAAPYGTVFDSNQLVYDDRSLSLEAGQSFKFAGGEALARAYYTDFQEYGDYPFAGSMWFDNIFTRQFGGELRLDTYVADTHHVLVGSDARYVQGRQAGGDVAVTPADHDIKEIYGQAALYAQDEFALGDGRVTAGARYDYYQSYSPQVHGRLNPRLAYVHRLAPGTSAKLVYGEAYRVPTQYEIFYTDHSSKLADPDLVPEVARTLEAIVDHSGANGARSGVSVYLTRLENAIVLQYPATCSGCNTYANLEGYQQVLGLEGHWSLRRGDGARAYASFNAQRGVAQPAGTQLSAAPDVLVKGGASLPLHFAGSYAGAEARYTSQSLGMVVDGVRRAPAPEFMRLDVFAATTVGHKSWTVTARIDNILDQTGYIVQPQYFDPLNRTPTARRTYALRLARDF